MLELQRLAVERQKNVGDALRALLAARHHPALHADVVARGNAVVQETDALAPASGPSAIAVKRATDATITAIRRVLDGYVHGLADQLVELDDAQRAAANAARRLTEAWFPDGIGFVHEVMNLEWTSIAAIVATFDARETRAAIEAVGLGPLTTRLATYSELFARAIGLSTGGTSAPVALERASSAWHDAYVVFAATVLASYPGAANAATRDKLFASYEAQLAEQKREMRSHHHHAAPQGGGTAASASAPGAGSATAG